MSNWELKEKNKTDYTNKLTSTFLAYILTDDKSYVLVGENEDRRLAWNISTKWILKEKNKY